MSAVAVLDGQRVAKTVGAAGRIDRGLRKARQIRRFDQPVQRFGTSWVQGLRIDRRRSPQTRKTPRSNQPETHDRYCIQRLA